MVEMKTQRQGGGFGWGFVGLGDFTAQVDDAHGWCALGALPIYIDCFFTLHVCMTCIFFGGRRWKLRFDVEAPCLHLCPVDSLPPLPLPASCFLKWCWCRAVCVCVLLAWNCDGVIRCSFAAIHGQNVRTSVVKIEEEDETSWRIEQEMAKQVKCRRNKKKTKNLIEAHCQSIAVCLVA